MELMKPKEGEIREFKILRPDGSILLENGEFGKETWLLADQPPKGWEEIFVGEGWYWFEISEDYKWSYVRKEKEGSFVRRG